MIMFRNYLCIYLAICQEWVVVAEGTGEGVVAEGTGEGEERVVVAGTDTGIEILNFFLKSLQV